MSLIAIAFIILLGIILLLFEFLIIPGVTVFGIGGFIFMLLGIGAAYYYHDVRTGNYTLLITVIASFITMYYVFKQKTWRKVGLKASIDSRHKPFDTDKVHPGESGKAVTRLAPVGTVRVNDILCEAKSITGFIDEGTEVEVVKVLEKQIIVKPKSP